ERGCRHRHQGRRRSRRRGPRGPGGRHDRGPGSSPGTGAGRSVCDDRPVTSPPLIPVAPTGAESAKADVPALPVTVEEIAATARDCHAVGASVIHLHIRDAETRPTLDLVYG